MTWNHCISNQLLYLLSTICVLKILLAKQKSTSEFSFGVRFDVCVFLIRFFFFFVVVVVDVLFKVAKKKLVWKITKTSQCDVISNITDLVISIDANCRNIITINIHFIAYYFKACIKQRNEKKKLKKNDKKMPGNLTRFSISSKSSAAFHVLIVSTISGSKLREMDLNMFNFTRAFLMELQFSVKIHNVCICLCVFFCKHQTINNHTLTHIFVLQILLCF